MNYIKVLPQRGLTSEERSEQISYELWAISRPISIRNSNDVTSYIFGWIKHPTQDPSYTEIVNTALLIDLDYNIVVHPQNNLTNLVSLFPELTTQEKENLISYIESNQSFPFKNIIPNDVKVFTKKEMEDSGWFITEEN